MPSAPDSLAVLGRIENRHVVFWLRLGQFAGDGNFPFLHERLIKRGHSGMDGNRGTAPAKAISATAKWFIGDSKAHFSGSCEAKAIYYACPGHTDVAVTNELRGPPICTGSS
jgi:hypothetical protein